MEKFEFHQKPATVRIEQAAKYAGISNYLIRKLAKEGKIPHIRAGNLYLFRLEALDHWLQEQEIKNMKTENASSEYGILRKIKG